MRAHSFFLVGAEKLHLPLLLYTGDRCHENLQQLQFVTGHNLRLLNQHQQLKKNWKPYQKRAKVQKDHVANQNCQLVCHS